MTNAPWVGRANPKCSPSSQQGGYWSGTCFAEGGNQHREFLSFSAARPTFGHNTGVSTTDWNPLLRSEFEEHYWKELQSFVTAERLAGPVYPAAKDVFAALHLTSFADTKVVLLGQDPYHGPGQAHGLCFSVQRGVTTPPSLRNIFRELHEDLGCPIPTHGNLEMWARNGVLLLNTTLTVRAGQAGSHQGQGWERFTDRIIRCVAEKNEHVVFILWGAPSRQKRNLIDTSRHSVIESAHPSPLSAHNGFFGSRPFSRANDALVHHGQVPVNWCLNDK